MEPNVLELNKKNCYVIHFDKLVMGVPAKKVHDYLTSLSNGLLAKGVRVFNLDAQFSISYAEKDDKITFSDGLTAKKAVTYEGNDKTKVLDWLKPYLEQNRFSPHAEAVSSTKLLIGSIGSIFVVLFIFGILYAAEGSSPRNYSGKARTFVEIANTMGPDLILIIGGACLLAAVIWTVVRMKKGDTQITYRK